MSYILDALQKSESERRQGRVPELGQQVQLIPKPKKKSSMVWAWVGVGLVLNATVLAYVFWNGTALNLAASEPASGTEAVASQSIEPSQSSEAVATDADDAKLEEPKNSVEAEPPSTELPQQASVAETGIQERPTIIVPSKKRSQTAAGSQTQQVALGSVPHLVELPLSFQRAIPDLVFNSHIYASDPSSRRVMINNQYLRVGESFAGIRVDQITEEGVVLSTNGRQFRVGSVRDWMSPE